MLQLLIITVLRLNIELHFKFGYYLNDGLHCDCLVFSTIILIASQSVLLSILKISKLGYIHSSSSEYYIESELAFS